MYECILNILWYIWTHTEHTATKPSRTHAEHTATQPPRTLRTLLLDSWRWCMSVHIYMYVYILGGVCLYTLSIVCIYVNYARRTQLRRSLHALWGGSRHGSGVCKCVSVSLYIVTYAHWLHCNTAFTNSEEAAVGLTEVVPFSLEDEFSKTSTYTKVDDWHSHSVVGEYVHIYIYIYICICVYICICIYICIHAYVNNTSTYTGWRRPIECFLLVGDFPFSANEPYNLWLFCGK